MGCILETKFNVMKYILRLLVSPAVFLLYFVYAMKLVVISWWNFLLYGGEMVVYKEDTKIADVYVKLEELLNKENDGV